MYIFVLLRFDYAYSKILLAEYIAGDEAAVEYKVPSITYDSDKPTISYNQAGEGNKDLAGNELANIVALVADNSAISTPHYATKDKLLRQSDFTYLGAFKVPKADMGGPQWHGLSYGGSVIAYNPKNNSLFIVGHDQDQLVAEIGIPEVVNSSKMSDLKTAPILQNLVDITEGKANTLTKERGGLYNGIKIGGLLVYGEKLVGTVYAYFDAAHEAVYSHFTSGLNLTDKGDFKGMFQVGTKSNPVPQAGMVAGYMAPIPANWQSILGSTTLTGQSCLAIIGRTSSGPAAFAFNPDQLSELPAPVTALLYYPIDHQTIGTYYTSYTTYNKGSANIGMVFPSGSKSILFIGQQGMGPPCYGPGTKIAAEQGNRYNSPPPNNTCGGVVMTDTADPCCYDPTNLNKGAHAYPYADFVWAYDADDLNRVKNKGRVVDNPSANLVDSVLPTSNEKYEPWFIKPYDMWQISYPTLQRNFGSVRSGAAAYDETTHKLYIVQTFVDDQWPIIHVFEIKVGNQ